MPMTPDEVVKVLKAEYDTNYPVETYDTRKQALSTAITLIQDYQKLRGRMSVEKIASIIRETKKISAISYSKTQAQSIVTYLGYGENLP